MKVIAQITSEIDQWFVSTNDLRSIRHAKKLLLNKLLLVADNDFKSKFGDSVRQSFSPEVVGAVLDLISLMPRATLQPSIKTDAAIGLEYSNGRTLDELADDDNIDILFGMRTATVQKGDARVNAYQRTLQPLASAARRIDIADRYASAVIVDHNQNRNWLLRKFLENPNLTVCVYTGLQPNPPNSFESESERMQKLETNVHMLLEQCKSFSGKLHLEVFEVNKQIFHNRRIRFSYEHADISVLLEKGLDTFANDPLPEQQVMATLQPGDFSTYLSTLRTQKLIGKLNFT
jgi:hypothetical protein